MTKIIKNAIQCKKCGDIIESTNVHDFVPCSCGACSMDGGHDYLHRCKKMDDMSELSEFNRSWMEITTKTNLIIIKGGQYGIRSEHFYCD